MTTYTDQAVLVDKLRKFFSDVPLVQQAAGMIEDLFEENEELRKENAGLNRIIAGLEAKIDDLEALVL